VHPHPSLREGAWLDLHETLVAFTLSFFRRFACSPLQRTEREREGGGKERERESASWLPLDDSRMIPLTSEIILIIVDE